MCRSRDRTLDTHLLEERRLGVFTVDQGPGDVVDFVRSPQEPATNQLITDHQLIN